MIRPFTGATLHSCKAFISRQSIGEELL